MIPRLPARGTIRTWVKSQWKLWPLPGQFSAAINSIRFAAKPIMEFAVALMGASISLADIEKVGPSLIAGIVFTVVVTIALGLRIGRALGLPERMALLVACGNAICGNSAIVAVAPAIAAESEDVAAAVGFTAAMGIVVVLLVAPLAKLCGMSHLQGGILAGMTVYAVPQVLAAANPLGNLAVHTATIVKLVRVLMLGPIVFALSLRYREPKHGHARMPIARFLPGFIVASAALALLHSYGFIAEWLAEDARTASFVLTVLAMAGLGLGVDMRNVLRAGGKVTVSVLLSLVVLFAGAFAIAFAKA